MAGLTGFEPVNDWIKTSCVRPLHHRPINGGTVGNWTPTFHLSSHRDINPTALPWATVPEMVGPVGFEPTAKPLWVVCSNRWATGPENKIHRIGRYSYYGLCGTRLTVTSRSPCFYALRVFASYGHENAIELTESIFRLPRTLAHAVFLLSTPPV